MELAAQHILGKLRKRPARLLLDRALLGALKGPPVHEGGPGLARRVAPGRALALHMPRITTVSCVARRALPCCPQGR